MKATDPAIETTRRVREDICRSLDHDPAKVIEHYMKMQERFGARLRHGPTGDRTSGCGKQPNASSKKRRAGQ